MNPPTHNYSHFYTLLKDMPLPPSPSGLPPKVGEENGKKLKGDRAELKEMLVERFTCGRTTSLKEMSYFEYRKMCAAMKASLPPSPSKGGGDVNLWRKRVMAAIGQYLRNLRRVESAEMIKGIACRAAQYDDFNLIPVSRLQNVYYAFLNKNKDFYSVGEVVYGDIEMIAFLN